MGFSGGYWRLREDRSHIDFLVPSTLQRVPIGVGAAGNGFRVLYEVPVDTCADKEMIEDWCRHLSEKIWAEGTIKEFRRIAKTQNDGGKSHGKETKAETSSA